jgi:hypothetical protein
MEIPEFWLAILIRIYENAPMELGADLRKALLCEDWEPRFKQAVIFAYGRICALRWKRGYTGSLPDGYDENSIAAEAIKQLFEGDCRITSVPYTAEQLDYEIMRLVSNLAHTLLRRKETVLVRGEQELEFACEESDQDCEMHQVRGNVTDPSEQIERAEAKAKLELFKNEFTAFLGSDQLLKALFICICNDILQREEIAIIMEVEPQVVTNTRKRLDRRLAEFALGHSDYPATFIKEMTNV